MRAERETLRLENLVSAAMRVAERLDEDHEGTDQATVAVDAAKEDDGISSREHDQSEDTTSASKETELAERRKRTKPLN